MSDNTSQFTLSSSSLTITDSNTATENNGNADGLKIEMVWGSF